MIEWSCFFMELRIFVFSTWGFDASSVRKGWLNAPKASRRCSVSTTRSF